MDETVVSWSWNQTEVGVGYDNFEFVAFKSAGIKFPSLKYFMPSSLETLFCASMVLYVDRNVQYYKMDANHAQSISCVNVL
ncbi:uncharacterized protein PHALS_14783 [Plasmopara halstedii]|uniref:Uncharacterized protein n=1 Tax=Plasmopara halstedii TaxID=4781 RepID=A0A0P1AVQ1_PLAHL|nr:uncharacterized protein PHALS_14783 [Plasmopara halstedii]CEG45146.1 hypothetical protein PHALS_14783 [Plasmopara halstedii]|eukprot:XP_024581515.1 hypothetical protein PHALS_14783 [Plasmopara halstedii]